MVVVAMGSVLGTIKDVVDGLRSDGVPVGVLGIGCFRPFPVVDVRRELAAAATVVVVEKAFSPGFGGVLSADVALALGGGSGPGPYGGGRPGRATDPRRLAPTAPRGRLRRTPREPVRLLRPPDRDRRGRAGADGRRPALGTTRGERPPGRGRLRGCGA